MTQASNSTGGAVKPAQKAHEFLGQAQDLMLARGGLHVIANLVIACPPCNFRKNAKDPFEFAASMGRLF